MQTLSQGTGPVEHPVPRVWTPPLHHTSASMGEVKFTYGYCMVCAIALILPDRSEAQGAEA